MSLRMACGFLIVFLVAAALVDAPPIGVSYAQTEPGLQFFKFRGQSEVGTCVV